MPEEFEHWPLWDISVSHMHQYLGSISPGLFKAYILEIMLTTLAIDTWILPQVFPLNYNWSKIETILKADYSVIPSCSRLLWKCGYWPRKDSRKNSLRQLCVLLHHNSWNCISFPRQPPLLQCWASGCECDRNWKPTGNVLTDVHHADITGVERMS